MEKTASSLNIKKGKVKMSEVTCQVRDRREKVAFPLLSKQFHLSPSPLITGSTLAKC